MKLAARRDKNTSDATEREFERADARRLGRSSSISRRIAFFAPITFPMYAREDLSIVFVPYRTRLTLNVRL